MAQPILDCSRVVACVGQCIAAGVPQHVNVNLEREAGALANALDQPIDGIGGEWGATLGFEYVATGCLALQLAKGAQLVAADRVGRWLTVLGAADVQCGGAVKFDPVTIPGRRVRLPSARDGRQPG